MSYVPNPIDTSGVILSPALLELTECLARNVHNIWARRRMENGWRSGPRRDDLKKEHPGLVPYEELTEPEKEFDRRVAMETLRAILAMGFRIER